MAEESRLIISVDARNAEKTAKALGDELKKLEKSGDNASTSISELGTSINSTNGMSPKFINSIKTMAGVMGTLAGASVGVVTALAGASIAYAKSAKELSNFATLADANVVEFQRMAVAAERYGVTSEQLSDQLKDFNEKLGEFILTGGGEGKDAFEFLAKNTKKSADEVGKFALAMQKASGPDALLMYVDRLEKAGVSNEQLSFLVENMGNDLTKLLPILRNGGKELKALADEADRLGVIMDEKAVAQALELEKQISLLQKQAKGATNQFMSGFIPAVLTMSEGMNEAAGNSDLLKTAGEDMGDVLKGVSAIAVGAYVAISSLSRAILAVAQDTLDAKKLINQGAEEGGFFSNLPGVKLARTLIAAPIVAKAKDSNTSNALDKNAKVSEDAANYINNLWDETERRVNERMAKIGDPKQGSTAGLKTFKEDMAKDAEDAKAKAKKTADEIAKLQEQIIYKYGDREKQIEIDLANDIKDIRESKISNPEIYIDAAKKRAYLEKQIYLSQLQFEINEFKMSEEQKLKYSFEIKQLQLQQNTEITDKTREIALKALDEQYDYESKLLLIAKEERALQMREQFLTETQAMEARYDLELRKLIEVKDADERNFNERMIQLKKQEEVLNRLKTAQDNFARDKAQKDGTNPYIQASDARFASSDLSQKLFDAQMSSIDQQAQDPTADINHIAKLREEAYKAHKDRMAQIDKDYQTATVDLNLKYGGEIAGSLADMYKSMRGEQSRGFKVLFAAEKAFALARATIALGENISRASSVGFPYNLPLIAGAVAQGATIFSIIRSVKDAGFQTGGYTGNGGVSDVAGVVHGQEYVLNAAATKRVGVGTLDAVNSGANLTAGSNVNITINTPAGYAAQQTMTSEGITIDIVRKEAQNAVTTAFQNLNNANSTESRQITRNFNTTRAR